MRTREPESTIPGRRGSRTGATDSVAFSDEFRLDLADPTAFGSVQRYSGTGVSRSVDISVSTKIPVTDLDSGVGTGEWDYSVGGSVAMSARQILLFGSLTHCWLNRQLSLGAGFGLRESSPDLGLSVGWSVGP